VASDYTTSQTVGRGPDLTGCATHGRSEESLSRLMLPVGLEY